MTLNFLCLLWKSILLTYKHITNLKASCLLETKRQHRKELLKYLNLPSLNPRPYILGPLGKAMFLNITIDFSSRWHRISFNTLLNTQHYPQGLRFRGATEIPRGWPGSWRIKVLPQRFHGLLCDLQQATSPFWASNAHEE